MGKEIEIYSIGPMKEYYPNTISADSCSNWSPRWTHFVVTRDASGKGSLIVNGTSRIAINIDPISGTKVILGDPDYYGSRQFSGYLDELYIVNRVFTDDELKQLSKANVAAIRQSSLLYTPHLLTTKNSTFDLTGKRFSDMPPKYNGLLISRDNVKSFREVVVGR